MDNNILKLKADSYDVYMELEGKKKEVVVLEEKLKTLAVQIEALSKKTSPVLQDISNETRAKEQRIMQKRISKTGKKPIQVPEDNDE